MFDLALTVQHARFIPGAIDAHGDEVEAWGEAVDVDVYGLDPTAADAAVRVERSGYEVTASLLAPTGFTAHKDKIWVHGKEYLAVGEPRDYQLGPFGFNPGVVIDLHRVEG